MLLGTDTVVKQIPKLVGPILSKIGRFPQAVSHAEPLAKKVNDVKCSIKFQLKKVLCLEIPVPNVSMVVEQTRQNITTAINLISLLKKGWNNIRTLYIKTSMGKPIRIHG